jgi:hypothetical protein
MTKERKYILIDCSKDCYMLAYEYCRALLDNGDYYEVNITANEKQFDVKSVTKKEFEEATK